MAYEDLAKELAKGGNSKGKRRSAPAMTGAGPPDAEEKQETTEDPEEEKLETPEKEQGAGDDEKGDAVNDSLSSYDDVEGSAGDELAALSGAKDKGAYKTALSQYVRACLAKYQKESE